MKIYIQSKDIYTKKEKTKSYDLVISATGYKDLGPGLHQETIPPLLKNLEGNFKKNNQGFCQINYNYSLQGVDEDIPSIFLNGLCESTHGASDAGSFSLLSLRAKKISNSIQKALSYNIESGQTPTKSIAY